MCALIITTVLYKNVKNKKVETDTILSEEQLGQIQKQADDENDKMSGLTSTDDKNETGESYMSFNRPSNSKSLILYYPDPYNEMKMTKSETFIEEENMTPENIATYVVRKSTKNPNLSIEANLVGNTVNVVAPPYSVIATWQGIIYPEKSLTDKKKFAPNDTGVGYVYNDFTMLCYEALSKTLKESLNVEAVSFVDEDQIPIKLEGSHVKDGIYFNREGNPKFLYDKNAIYKGMNFQELVNYWSSNVEDISKLSEDQQMDQINLKLSAQN